MYDLADIAEPAETLERLVRKEPAEFEVSLDQNLVEK
jgi:hypothetical protein